MTGTRAQLYNGIALLFTFFSCRLIWGTWQSLVVYRDLWLGVHNSPDAGYVSAALITSNATLADPNVNPLVYVKDASPVPVWLAGVYIVSNIILNTLNWFWFVKMIAAVKKRFEPAKENEKVIVGADGKAAAVVTGRDGKQPIKHRRQHSIEDVIPDSEELREGTIQ